MGKHNNSVREVADDEMRDIVHTELLSKRYRDNGKT